MRAVTFHAPGDVRVEERPEPEPLAPDDAVVAVEATGICGSDLHIYHGRVAVEEGFTIGHEYVGTVVAAGAQVTRVKEGDRVLGCFQVACGTCFFCLRGLYHKCDESRVFGHGSTLGSLPGAQADRVLVPHANLTLRPVPDGMPHDLALFAGDVMATGYHAIVEGGLKPGELAGVVGLGPVGLCAVQAALVAGAAHVVAVDRVPDRLEVARSFGAEAIHLEEDDPRSAVKRLTDGRGLDLVVDAVGHPAALDLALRMTRKGGTLVPIGVYAERAEVHMGLLWLRNITMRGGQANAIRHVDDVLALMSAGRLDPSPLVSRHMRLEEAPEAYAVYDRREALKIVLTP